MVQGFDGPDPMSSFNGLIKSWIYLYRILLFTIFLNSLSIIVYAIDMGYVYSAHGKFNKFNDFNNGLSNKSWYGLSRAIESS